MVSNDSSSSRWCARRLSSQQNIVGIGDGAKLGATAGAIGGLIFVLIGAPLAYFLVGSVMTERTREAGINLPLDGFLALLLGLLVVAVIGFVLAIIGGVIAALVLGRR